MPTVTLSSAPRQGPLNVQLYTSEGTPVLKAPELLSAANSYSAEVELSAGTYTAVATQPSGETVSRPVDVTADGGGVDFSPAYAEGPFTFMSSAAWPALPKGVQATSNLTEELSRASSDLLSHLMHQTSSLMGAATEFLPRPTAEAFRAIRDARDSSPRSHRSPLARNAKPDADSGSPYPSWMNPFLWMPGMTGATASPTPGGSTSDARADPEPRAGEVYDLYAWAVGRRVAAAKDYRVRKAENFLEIEIAPNRKASPKARVHVFGLLDEAGFGPIVVAPSFVDGLAITFLPQGVGESESAERVSNPSAIRVPVATAAPKATPLADLLAAVNAPMFPDADKLWTEQTRLYGGRSKDVLEALSHNNQDTHAAVLSALFLARFKPAEAPIAWLRDLDALVPPPVADAKILLARRLIHGGEAEPSATADEIGDLLQAAAARPLCLFASNRSFLTQSLRLHGLKARAPTPGDFLDVAADADGLEAFWGSAPFTPGRQGAPSGEPALHVRLENELFVYPD